MAQTTPPGARKDIEAEGKGNEGILNGQALP